MDVQMPVRKPFATEYVSAPEENGALGNIFTELYETLGFLERNYQTAPNCSEQIKSLLTGSPLVSLPKTMEFSFYDQAQHELNVEPQHAYYETPLNNSKNTWAPIETTDLPTTQYNSESLYSRKTTDRCGYEESNKNNENLQVVSACSKPSEIPLLPRKRKIDVVMQDNKVQIMSDVSETAGNATRVLQEQFKNNSKFANAPRIAWPADDLSLTDDDDLDTSYNISDALLSLSSLTNLKQESASSGTVKLTPSRVSSGIQEVSAGQMVSKEKNDENICFQELLNGRQSQNIESSKTTEAGQPISNHEVSRNTLIKSDAVDCRFQYVLGAATSIATKLNEESLTYLNQRQPYEIKLKKLGDLSAYKGKILKTIIRICFHERRLQFMEKEQIKLWKEAHPGERIIDIDVPLSYGLHRIAKQTDNSVELFWDPMKETGIYIKVNCISTEFTPKKHGGEKGVPFRIQVETYHAKSGDNFQENSCSSELLHAAFCQIRVFKLKGADRKHKQDRDKILKRSALEQKRYKPSCDCTILNSISCDSVMANYPQPNTVVQRSPDNGCSPNRISKDSSNASAAVKHPEIDIATTNGALNSPESARSDNLFSEDVPLSQDTNTERMSQWLQNNRFSAYLTTFSHFSGSDIWSLSRDDLIQICGVPDGIRLYNALHAKIKSTPCLTFYICSDASSPCNAIYLQTLTVAEFVHKVRQFLISTKPGEINSETDGSYWKLPFYLQGPGGIHVILTNELISNIHEKTIFTVSIEQSKVILQIINKYE